MKENVLEIKGLTKKFGRLMAVSQLDLSISQGSVFGILGPNGSGKTTTLGMVLGVVRPTSGSYSWFGNGEDHKVRQNIGAILEKPVFYPGMSARKNLEIAALIKEVDKKAIDPALEAVGLAARSEDPFKSFSLGMKQRLSIASALLRDPQVLVLDEPTNGLDPQGIAEIREIIGRIAAMDKTIVLASHLLNEVQKVCSSFCVLRLGELVYSGPVLGQYDRNIVVISSNDLAKLKEVLANIKGVVNVEEKADDLIVSCDELLSAESLNRSVFDHGIVLSKLEIMHRSLEEQFLEILKEDHDQTV